MSELQKEIGERLERMEPGERVSFGPYTIAELIAGWEPLPDFGMDRISDAIAADCRMAHERGEPEPASIQRARLLRAEFEMELAEERREGTCGPKSGSGTLQSGDA